MEYIGLDVKTRATAAVFCRIRVIKDKPFTIQTTRVLKRHADQIE